MIPQVIPVSATQVNWNQILGYVDSNGRRPSRMLDRSGMGKTPESYIFLLGELSQPGRIVIFPPVLFRAISFGFLITASRSTIQNLVQHRQHGQLLVGHDGCSAIWTETMEDWVKILIDEAGGFDGGEHSGIELQVIHNKLFLSFESVGLRNCWAEYRKKPVLDGFILELKG